MDHACPGTFWVVCRSISITGVTMRLGTFSSASKRNNSFTASLPISMAGCRIVVSFWIFASGISSKPISERFPGISTSFSDAQSRIPSAILSFSAKTAVSWEAMSLGAIWYPLCLVISPQMIGSTGDSMLFFLMICSKPRKRSSNAEGRGSALTMPICLCPSERRYSAAIWPPC